MSFIGTGTTGLVYAPGYFLKNCEQCTRETYEIPATGATTGANGGKYVPMGTLYKVSDSPIGFLYEDVDVSDGAMPGSVVTKGEIYEDRLPQALDGTDKSALVALGFKFVNSSSVVRPDFNPSSAEGVTGETGAEGATGET